jgi:hypothetical protein
VTDPAVMPAADLALLKAFEPVVRFTQGEMFFPAAVEPYLAASDLLVGSSQRHRREILAVGEVTPDRLAAETAPPGEQLYLQLVQRPLDGLELVRWRQRPGRPAFRQPGRLARVGLFARLVDAGFSASLLLRGTVPGGTAAAAEIKYAEAQAADPRYVYHGRVIRQGGWIVLHYLYYYWMNDWRSSFYGANDHEADLEQVFVVLEDGPDPRPVWFGCAAHDYSGDQLRRRWDDPGLRTVGDHPVVHAGAGSHAAYVEPGEYVTTVPLPSFRPGRAALGAVRVLWRDVLRQADPGDLAARVEAALSIPFIDYARGDGITIGEGGLPWEAVPVSDATSWVHGYRGLWGLDTRDRFGGERAPAGPKYTRSGTVRQSWNDPLGFLGLTKTPPPGRHAAVLEGRMKVLSAERAKVVVEAKALRDGLPALEAETAALSRSGAMARLHAQRREDVAERVAALAALEVRRADLDDSLEAAAAELERVRRGEFGGPRDHLAHMVTPEKPSDRRYGRMVEAWSAASASLLLVAVVALLFVVRLPIWAGVGLTVAGFVVVEAVFRRRLVDLMLRITVLLAAVGAVVLLVTNAALVLVLAVLTVAVLTLVDNLGEIAGR